MKKIGIAGVYGIGSEFSGGQPVKTKVIIEDLTEAFGEEEVQTVNTFKWKKNPFKLLKNCLNIVRKCKNIIILPAQNGIKVFTFLFLMVNILYKRKIHYIVIGGWLPSYVKKSFMLKKGVSKFTGIYVETSSMKNELKSLGLNNVYIMNNYKNITSIEENTLDFSSSEPHKLCIFSRVVKEKGIEDAINAVIAANNSLGRQVFQLDIFGYIDIDYKENFKQLLQFSPEYIQYKGVVDPQKSVETLKSYFMLLFPTRYKTEGIPGTIIDSYCSGVPVLSSRWDSFSDVVIEGETGLGYELYNSEDLISKLIYVSYNPQTITKMKINCLSKSSEYSKKYVLEDFIRHLE